MQAYDNQAKTFSQSRKNMHWPELEYFFSQEKGGNNLIDLGCGSGRLLMRYHDFFNRYPKKYIGVDTSRGLLQEAQALFPDHIWIHANMLELSKHIREPVESIFSIASFHHLQTREERLNALQEMYISIKKGGRVYMTNWALLYGSQKTKYIQDRIMGGDNDFSIKLGDSDRYYHGFLIEELEELFKQTGWNLLENCLFKGEKNIISILEK